MDKLVKALTDNQSEVKKLIAESQDWRLAFTRFDTLFKSMSNPADKVWSDVYFIKFKEVYFAQRDKDKGMSNIIVRTVAGMPDKFKNNCKIMFLQMAEVCSLFNASHKVNFDAEELPKDFDAIKMIPGKSKGLFTYAKPTPSIYKKTSLTFDYWVPKFIEWTEEIRSKKLKDWQGNAILQYESCTDFIRVCLLFLSDIKNNPPIAKAEDREAILKLFGKEFIWIKKSAKREDIPGNNDKIVLSLKELNKRTGIAMPFEAWVNIQQAPFIKSLIK
ncbi:MAG: hypothetical protein QM737_15035 [Ferruginibacter sp.]